MPLNNIKLKSFKTEKGVKAAVKRQGIDGMNWKVISHPVGGFAAKFYVMDFDDWQEIVSRGFEAEIDPAKAAL